MLEENRRIFERCNILQWHKAGYTGKGVKIGVIDLDNKLFDWQEGKVTKIEPTAWSANGHCAKCFSVLMQIAPDAEYYLLPAGSAAYRKALELDLDIVSASVATWYDKDADNAFGKEDCTTILFGAASNDGGVDGTDTVYPASYDWSICVAGVTASNDKFYTTSTRNDDMDCCGYTVVSIRCNGDYVVPFNGTSCATPWAAGVYALYRQKVGKQNWKQAKEFIHKNCIDYLDEGWDNWSGYGLFVLPDLDELDMKIGNKEVSIDVKPVEESITNTKLKSECDFMFTQGTNYYIQKIHPSNFNIKKLGKPKKSITDNNAFNLDYFGGSPMQTVCNLATNGKVVAETRTMVGSNTSKKPQTTLLVFNDGTARMETTNNISKYKDLRCAIGGVPFMIDGKEVSLSRDIKVQGWSGGNFYKTWHTYLTVQDGMIWYIGANSGHSNDVKATTVIWEFLKSIGCTGTVIKLDGGGSFIFKKDGKIVQATNENRTINYIGTWEDQDNKTKILLNGKEKNVDAILIDGQTFVKLRDLADNHIFVSYDAAKKIPVVEVK